MGTAGVLKCLSCAAVDSALIQRASVMSMVVGTILTLINQEIFSSQAHIVLAWRGRFP